MMHRANISFRTRAAVAAVFAWALLSCAPVQAATDCAQKLDALVEQNPGKGSVEEAQKQLVTLGFRLEKVDGKLGPETKGALKSFCDGAQFALSDDLLVMLRNHAAIVKVYPDWTTTLGSNGFSKWTAKQSDAQEIGWIRSAGDSGEVIRLLDRYRKQKAATPAVRSVDEPLLSYGLNGDDLKILAAGDGVFNLIGKLQGKSFSNRADFEAALDAALKGVTEPEQYVQAVLKNTAPQRSVELTEASFKALKAKNVPAYVLQAVQDMQGAAYPAGEIEGAVEAALGKVSDNIVKFKPQIVGAAEIAPSGARFTEGSFAKFLDAHKDDPLAAAVAERLRSMEGVEYQSDKTLSRAVENVLKQETDQVRDAVPVILDAAEETQAYRLDDAALVKLQDELGRLSVPEIYIEMLADLKNADYPDGDFFWAAAKARVAMEGSNDPCKLIIFGVIEKHRASALDDTLFDEMKNDKLPPAVLAELSNLAGAKFDSPQALEDAVTERFGQLSEQFEQYKPLVIAQARKEHPFDPGKAIQWGGEGCNCVASNLAGDIYGFYPYWLAGDRQKIDFSVLTRVEYYALGFDDKGNIPGAARWSGQDTGFIDEARVYGSKIDLVIYRNDWKTWNQLDAEAKTEAFAALADNILKQLDIPLTSFSARAKPYVSFGMAPKPIRGDGVTLYFDGYPEDAESVDAFVAFVRTLSDTLRAEGHRYAVNIMFRSSAIGRGAYDYQRLLDLMDVIEKTRKMDGKFLVLLQEPTTTDKKLLRINIENGLHGKDRMKLLHDIAVVLSPDRRGGPQLVDDVIYASDNFGGIGFWTQPVATGESDAADGAVSKVLHENYLKSTGKIAVKPAVCRFICPNRWAFRITWDIFIGVWLLATLLYFVLCSWRTFIEKNFIYFIAAVVVPMFLLSLALLFCDPSWESVSKDNGLLILLVVGIIAYSIWNYRENKRKANLP